MTVIPEPTEGDIRMKDFDRYQYLSRLTAFYPDLGDNIIYPTLGLNGEAGEIAEKVKKYIRDDREFSAVRDEIMSELGDVLWYVAALCTELKIPMSEVAQSNIDKLLSRLHRDRLSGSGDNR